jgi:TusA-related sulfurtransferase
MNAINNDEERIVARGLRPPGPLLLLRKRLRDIDAARLRVIVSSREAAEEIVSFLEARGARAEVDRAGDDYHVIADISRYKDVD